MAAAAWTSLLLVGAVVIDAYWPSLNGIGQSHPQRTDGMLGAEQSHSSVRAKPSRCYPRQIRVGRHGVLAWGSESGGAISVALWPFSGGATGS